MGGERFGRGGETRSGCELLLNWSCDVAFGDCREMWMLAAVAGRGRTAHQPGVLTANPVFKELLFGHVARIPLSMSELAISHQSCIPTVKLPYCRQYTRDDNHRRPQTHEDKVLAR